MEQPTPTPQHLAAVVMSRMALREMSQRDLAAGINVPAPTLHRRLNGSPFLSTELAAIANVLGAKVSDLVAEAEALAAREDVA